MIVNTILILLATATSGVICYFTGTYTTWWWVLIFVLFIPILYIIWFGIYLVPLWIASLFMNIKIKKGKPQPENGSKICYWFVITKIAYQYFIFGRVINEQSCSISNWKDILADEDMGLFPNKAKSNLLDLYTKLRRSI